MRLSTLTRNERTSQRGSLKGALFAGALVTVLGLSACTIGDTDSDEQAGGDSEAESVPELVVNTSFEDGDVDANPRHPISLEVENGSLTDVTVTNEEGREIEGDFVSGDTEWSTTEVLGYNRDYTVSYEATDEAGEVTTEEVTMSTARPDYTTSVSMVTGEGTTVGVGQPVAVRFDTAVPDRHAAEEAIEVRTEPEVEGAFYWLSPQEVRWRPAEYWDPGTKIEVDVNIYGEDLGGGVYGAEDAHSNFEIGDEVITTVDDNTKTMVTRVNGEVVNSVPVSLGKASTPTPNGTYLIGDRVDHMIMDSSTFGVAVDSAEGYRTPVNYATQMSYSGIYVHGAPWSVWAQGNTNVSNGCINVTDADAQWFLNNHKRGDIVEVSNTIGPDLPGTDGLGDWNIPWETWSAGNADQH